MKVVVLGGSGHFGAVIAAALAADAAFEVVIAGRDARKASAVADRLGPRASAALLDLADPTFAARLRDMAPALVVSAAGPFQARDYAAARAAIGAGAHYIDIGDGRDYVCGIGALDGEARAQGLLVTSGASSVPALSSAVVDRYAPGFACLTHVDIGISTSSRLPGAATRAAVLGYCGRPFPAMSGGAWRTLHGGHGLRLHRFEHPRMRRWLADCDVPDLALLPARHPTLEHVRFGAGVEPVPIQWGLWLLATLVRAGLVRDVVRWEHSLAHAARRFEAGNSGRSAMFVTLRGRDGDGRAKTVRWELFAAADDGMRVPCMAAVALARKLAAGTLHARGAMPCVGLVTLEEYLHELRDFKVLAHEPG